MAGDVYGGRRSDSVSASVAGGTDRLFAGGELSAAPIRNARIVSAVASFGTDQPLTLDNRVHVCPLASFGISRHGDNVRGRAAAGASLGLLLKNGGRVAVVSALAVRVHARANVDPFASVEAALALILHNRVLLRPSVARVAGDARVGLSIAVLLHGARGAQQPDR